MLEERLLLLAKDMVTQATTRNLKIATAESCTGGLVSAYLTAIPGASAVFDLGFVTYSNAVKESMLGVSPQTIADFGAVSADVAKEMAEGAVKTSGADIAVSITGIAGPDGGSTEKPVGLVYIALAKRGEKTDVTKNNFKGDRADVRTQSAEMALNALLSAI